MMKFRFKVVALVCFFSYYGYHPLYAQSYNSESSKDSISIEGPKAIAPVEIIQKIEEVREEIKAAKRKVPLSSSIVEIDSLNLISIPFIQEQEESAKNFIKSNPNRQKVDNFIKKWEVQYDNFEIWENTINDHAEKNLNLLEKIERDEEIWELTYDNAVAEEVPSEVQIKIKAIWNDLKDVKTKLTEKNNKLLKLESRSNSQKIVITKVIDELIALKNSEIYDLFYLRHEPLWGSSFNPSEDFTFKKNKNDSFLNNLKTILKLFKTEKSIIYLYIIFMGFVIYLILSVKKSYLKSDFQNKEVNLQHSKRIITQTTLPSIIFLALVISKLFFPFTPTLYNDFVTIVLLMVSVPLIQSFMHERFRKIIYFVIVFYILDSAKAYIWFSALQYRFYLLAQALLVVGIIVRFTYPYVKTRKMDLGKFGLLLIRLTPVIYFLVGISIVSNILGYTNLTDITLKISTQGGIITIIFYTMLMIVGGIVVGVIHKRYSGRPTFDPAKKLAIELKALQIIRIIIFVYWLFFFLQLLDLVRPIGAYFTDLFMEPQKIGSLTFTIGAVVNFILILTISFLITSFVSFTLDNDNSTFKFFKLPKGIPAAISLVIRYFIIAFGIVLAFSSLGVDLSQFNLMAGALGLGIGFGLQTVISNFVSGLILVFERPILPGDVIEVNNLLGTVNKIGVRASNIRTFEGSEVVVPNNSLISNDLINWTHSDKIKRVEILIGTTYDSDPNEILKILYQLALDHKGVLKNPPPLALFNEFGESSLDFRLLFWVDYDKALGIKSDVSIKIYNEFKALNIEIPFPQRDVYIKNEPEQIQIVTKPSN